MKLCKYCFCKNIFCIKKSKYSKFAYSICINGHLIQMFPKPAVYYELWNGLDITHTHYNNGFNVMFLSWNKI